MSRLRLRAASGSRTAGQRRSRLRTDPFSVVLRLLAAASAGGIRRGCKARSGAGPQVGGPPELPSPKIMICCSSIRSGVLYQELAPKQVGRRTPIITYDYANASSGIPQRSAPGTAGLYRCPGLTGKAFANPCLGSEVIVAYWASKEQGGTMATGISFFFVSKRRHTPSVGASQPKTYGLISHKGQLYSGRRSVIDVRKRDKKERPL